MNSLQLEEEEKRVRSAIRKDCFADETQDIAGGGCGRVFDGFFYCWPSTKPGGLASQPCSNQFVKSEQEGLVTKWCTENGTWMAVNSNDNWINVSQCGIIHYVHLGAIEEQEVNETWLYYTRISTLVGYTISLILLVTALVIFIYFKKLHCERNKLHKNLFVSYILRAVTHLANDLLFFEGVAMAHEIVYDNGKLDASSYTWTCKLLVTIHWYCVLSNFILLLMEGLYLNNLIFLNMFSECHGTTIYCLVGWLAPIFLVVPWAISKYLYENQGCWNINENSLNLIIDIPIDLTVVVNLILFIIIVRVLVVKLHFTSTFAQHKKFKYIRKLMKSTLILIPLYGVPFTLSLAVGVYVKHSYPKNNKLENVWIFADQTFISFLGSFAALVYCLLNSDVRHEIVRKYTSVVDQTDKEFRRSRTISSNTQQISLHNQDDTLENLKLFGIVDDDLSRTKGLNGHSIEL